MKLAVISSNFSMKLTMPSSVAVTEAIVEAIMPAVETIVYSIVFCVRYDHGRYSTSVPTDIVQLDSNVYFGSFQDRWSSVDLHTGRINWSFSTGAPN